ncbi:hypothetical protein [Haloferula sp. A504]|uniref:hypothetical protein n=1 Tax=Haloferula sp. A504 TaxID=3373601 RepID=UPI0031C66853|nr:hypothetical protein [Verrucomicrobiaceae bacterium E54]
MSFRAPFCGASHGVGDVVPGEGDLEFFGMGSAALDLEAVFAGSEAVIGGVVSDDSQIDCRLFGVSTAAAVSTSEPCRVRSRSGGFQPPSSSFPAMLHFKPNFPHDLRPVLRDVML